MTSFFTTVLQHFSTSPVLQVSLQSVPTENPVDEGSSLGAAGNGPFLGFVVGIPDLGLNKMMAKIFGKPSNTTLFDNVDAHNQMATGGLQSVSLRDVSSVVLPVVSHAHILWLVAAVIWG